MTHDVVVVGGGLAGLNVARECAERGLRVLLVDRKPSPDVAIVTSGIFVRRTWEDFDLPERHLGPPIRRVVLFSPARRRLELTSPRDEFRIGRMREMVQHFLAEALDRGVEWRPRTRFLESRPIPGGSRVLFETEGARWEAETRYLVGADGPLSTVAKDLGLSRNERFLVGVEEVRRAEEGEPARELQCFLDPVLAPGYLAWAASDGVESHVGVGGEEGRFAPAAALRRFRESLREPWRLSAEPTGRRGGRIPVGGLLPRIVSRRGLVVGDAAGAVSPLTAGGLDPCFRLSALAARVIGGYLAHGDTTALRAYDGAALRRRFAVRLGLRHVLSGIRSPFVLESGWFLLRATPLASLARHVFFGRGSFPDVNGKRNLWTDEAY